jgi:hypothetical protein
MPIKISNDRNVKLREVARMLGRGNRVRRLDTRQKPGDLVLITGVGLFVPKPTG